MTVIESRFSKRIDKALEEEDWDFLEKIIHDQSLLTYNQDKVEDLLEMFLDEIILLRADIEDIQNSHCASFERCENCKRLHDASYVCPYCGKDGSI